MQRIDVSEGKKENMVRFSTYVLAAACLFK